MSSIRVHPRTTGKPKYAIGSLCQLLNLTGVSCGLTAEIFRQAKFNKPQAVAPMSSLLATLVQHWAHGCTPFKALHTMASPIGHDALQCCCSCCQYLHDGVSGSRDLLLACGWLLAKTDILAKLMAGDDQCSPDISQLHADELEKIAKHDTESKLVTGEGEGGSAAGDASDSAKRLSWLVGRCQMARKRLYYQQQELCNLNHQIHIATQGVSLSPISSHLSSLETYVIRNSRYLKQESVLDAKLQDSTSDNGFDDVINLLPSKPQGENLTQHLRELDECTRRIEQLAQEAVLNDETSSSSGVHIDCHKILEEVSTQLNPRLPSSSSSSSSNTPGIYPQAARFYLVNRTSKPSSGPAVPHPEAVPHVQREIERLEAASGRLRRELDSLRSDHRAKVEELTMLLTGAVCVPPMTKRCYHTP